MGPQALSENKEAKTLEAAIETEGYVDENYQWVEVPVRESETIKAKSIQVEAGEEAGSFDAGTMAVVADGVLAANETASAGKKILTLSPLLKEAGSELQEARGFPMYGLG